MCGCGGAGSFPGQYGHVIAELRRGDEITIAAGYGEPEVATDRIDVVVDVDGFSALTELGTMLACCDGAGVTKTGQRRQELHFNDEARRILTLVGHEDALNIEV